MQTITGIYGTLKKNMQIAHTDIDNGKESLDMLLMMIMQ